MRKLCTILIILLVTAPLFGQIRTPGPRRPPKQPELVLPVRIGITQVASDCGIWPYNKRCTLPNWQFAEEVAHIGVRAVKVWPSPQLFGGKDENMHRFWTNPDIDTYVVRPIWNISAEGSCKADGSVSLTWENEDIWSIVKQFYRKYGHLDKTIIITNWEGDWQLRGTACRNPEDFPERFDWYAPSNFLTTWRDNCEDLVDHYAAEGVFPFDPPYQMGVGGLFATIPSDQGAVVACASHLRWSRAEYLRKVFNERQRAINHHRRLNPNAALKVLHAIVVNHPQEEWDVTVSRDVIPFLDYKPDLIGLSHWKSDVPIADALDDIERFTGFARQHIYVDEFGSQETYEGQQYEKLYTWGEEALQWGCRMVFVWLWKQYYDGVDLGLVDLASGEPRSGVDAIMELRDHWEVQ